MEHGGKNFQKINQYNSIHCNMINTGQILMIFIQNCRDFISLSENRLTQRQINDHKCVFRTLQVLKRIDPLKLYIKNFTRSQYFPYLLSESNNTIVIITLKNLNILQERTHFIIDYDTKMSCTNQKINCIKEKEINFLYYNKKR